MASATQQTTTPAGPPAPGEDAVLFATLFLKGIGAPLTANNYANFFRWANTESGGQQAHGGWNNYNPLNIVATPGDGSTGQGGTQGNIADFPNVQAGAQATVNFFNSANGGAPSSNGLITAFKNDAPTDALQSGIRQFYTWSPSFSMSGGDPNPPALIGPLYGQGGQASTQAVLTSKGGLLGIPDWIKQHFGSVPIAGSGLTLGEGFGAVTDTASFFGALGKLFSNWHYVAYVLGGVGVIILGMMLIAHDTGVDSKLARGGAKAVEIGAVA